MVAHRGAETETGKGVPLREVAFILVVTEEVKIVYIQAQLVDTGRVQGMALLKEQGVCHRLGWG